MLPSKPVTFLVVHAAAVELYFWGGACQAAVQSAVLGVKWPFLLDVWFRKITKTDAHMPPRYEG